MFSSTILDGAVGLIFGFLTVSMPASAAAVAPAANPQINGLLKGIAQRPNGSLAAMKEEIAAWFDNSMDRVSGVYKRWSQVTNFVIAFILAIFLNISAIHVAKVLW